MTRKHLVLMIIGCVLPMTALAAILLLQVQINAAPLIGLFLICPALHLLMMRDHTSHALIHPEMESDS